ncbi:MAG: HAD family hydrolase [Proteobacteria bacterium]|nr:HAD family hydrolase [Pseudomonadota bacterium]
MIPLGGERGKRIKGVLFDLDGTLTFPGALDFPAIKREIACPNDIPILEYLETLPLDRKVPLFKILESKEVEAAAQSYPNTGAEKCLAALKERGLLLGIITRNSIESVRLALEKFRGVALEDFATIITREDFPPKPHPEGVHQAAKSMGLSTSELLVVGDFRFDVMAGKAAGALTVLLTNKKKPALDPGDPVPDYTIGYLEEILELTA